jgi:hypothetical protein
MEEKNIKEKKKKDIIYTSKLACLGMVVVVFHLEMYENNICFYFLKIIFNINISK